VIESLWRVPAHAAAHTATGTPLVGAMGRGGHPVTNTIYVANRPSDKVTVIDGRTNRAVQR